MHSANLDIRNKLAHTFHTTKNKKPAEAGFFHSN